MPSLMHALEQAAGGDGDAGETVTYEERVLQRSEAPHQRRYVSIFGELKIPRYVYSAGEKKAIEYAPLDADLEPRAAHAAGAQAHRVLRGRRRL